MTDQTPIACDMTSAPDTGPERLAEYHRLFTQSLVGRERTADGIRFRLRADDGVAAWVHDLAAREKACCPFFDFHIAADDEQVCWEVTVVDDDTARAVLEELYELPDTADGGMEEFDRRLGERGVQVTTNATGTVSYATPITP